MPAIGKAYRYTNEELTAISQVGDIDIAQAVRLWQKYAPPRFAGLVDNSSTIYIYRPEIRSWTIRGRRIDSLEIRDQAIEPFINNVRLAMRQVSENLQNGKISLLEWQVQMKDLVKYSQLAAAIVAMGGVENIGQDERLLIAGFILVLLAFLLTFAVAIEAGTQLLNGTLLSRAGLYAAAIRDGYSEADRYIAQNYANKTQERRVLDPGANHCHTIGDWIGCPELAEQGWQPIGTLPRLFDTPCRVNCKCHWEFI